MTSFFELHFDTKWREGLACQICLTKYKIFAEFKRHISSKEHQKKMTQVFQTESLSPSGKLPRIIVIERDVQLTTQQPLLGLQLLTICFSRTLSKVFYLCHICKENVRDNNILEHLNSNHHRVNYHSNNPDMEQLPCEDMSPSGRKRKLEENSDAGWMGALKILNLPQRLLNLYKDFSYYQAVMKSLDAYKVPKLFEGSEPKKLRIEEAQRNGPPHPDASEKSYKILCQNCNIEFNTQAQYFQHVENDQHVMWTRSLTRQGNNHSSSNPIELKDPRKAAQSFLSQSLNEGIFNQLDEHSVPGASMMVFCYCSKAKCDPICTCCACQDTFPKDLLKKHLESHKHLLQTLMYLNPWRLPFGWKQVPGRKFLESMVKMEEKERGWSQVVLKVMDLPFSLLNRINPPSFEKVMDELRIHQVVLKRNIPPCQTYSQCFENKTFPILGHNFIVSYECSHPSCDSMYDSLLCLMCGRLLVNQEDYAHVFSWEHVSTFLERFHPGSLTPQCDAKTFLELANKAARIHMVSHMQKIRLDRPIKESCTYDKVKVILGAAKKRGSKGLIIPLILPQAPLANGLPSKLKKLPLKNGNKSLTKSNGASTPKETKDETGQQRSGHVPTFIKEESQQKMPSIAQDEEIGNKKQIQISRENTPCEKKLKIKCETLEQKGTATTSVSNVVEAEVLGFASIETDSKSSALCSSSSNSTPIVVSSGFIAQAPNTSCTTNPTILLTTTASSRSTTSPYSYATKSGGVVETTYSATAPASIYMPKSGRVATTTSGSSVTNHIGSLTTTTPVVTSTTSGNRYALNVSRAAETTPSLTVVTQSTALKSQYATKSSRVTTTTALSCHTTITKSSAPTCSGNTKSYIVAETLPSDSSTSTKYMALSATTTLFSSRRVTSMYSSGTASTPKVTATTTCTTKSGNITTFSSGTSTTKKSTAPATVCTAPSSRVAASTTKSTEMNIHDCSTPSTGPGIKTKPVATTVTHGTTKTKTTPVIHDAKSSSLGTAPRTTTNLEATTVIHGAAPIISYPSPTIKDTATNPIHDATTSKLITTASTSSVTSCVVSTLEITAANSDPRTSITVSSSLHKAPKDGTERRIQGSSRTCEKNLSVPSHVVVPTSAEAVVRHRKSLNTDSKQKLYMCHPPSSRPGTSTAKIMNSKTKPTVSKIGQSFIVAVNCSGRKQSYCTLCGIRLDRSSHPTENIHLYNYMKWRFPELTDEQLAGINLEDFIFGMTEVEKCMGLRNFQTIRVTNDEYNHLSELPEAQALQKLKTHFLVSSNTLTALEQVSPASLHGATSPEDALDTEAHASTSTSLTAEPEATVQTTRQGEFSETMSGQQKIDDHDDFAEENPEGLNDSLTSVSLGPESQLNEENDDECSPSVLLGPDLHIGDTDVKDMEESLSSFNEPSPELSLGPEQQIASTGSKDVQDLEGSESGSSLELIEPDTHFSDRELELEDEDLEVSNRASPSSPGPELPPELETGTQNRIVRCKTERESILHDAPIDEGSNVSQVPILGPGNGSNLNSFLWVRYRSKKPIIGLSSVYECCGTLKDSFYLCESCDQKFSLQDICQHIVSDEHQLKYMLRAYPHLLDSFWYDEDLMQEMKLDILNDVIVKIAAQERSKNSDAKVVFLCQDMYESVWNAPFAEALDMLQHGTFQPGVSSQQNENRASEQQSGQTKDLPVDMNADSVPASSSARTSFGAQKTCTSSHIPTQPSILSPVCSTSPPFQMKVEQMDMQYKPPENLVSVTKAPYFVQVKNEPMSWQVQPHERPSPISKDQPSLEVKAVTMPQEHETAKAISEEQLHFKVKDKPKPQVSETTKAIPEKQIEDIKSAFPLKPKSKSAGRTFETHPSFEWIFEPVSSESDSGEPAGVIFEKCSYHTKAEHLPSESASFETVDPVFEGQPRYQIKAVLMPSESESFKTAGPKFNEQPSFDWIFEPVSSESESGETAGPIFEKHSYRAKAEPLPSVSESFETADHLKAGLMPSESEPFETAGPIYMEQPGFQMKAEPMPQECQGHGTADPVLEEFQMPNIFQIKDGVALLPLGSPVTATQGTDNVPSSQVKAEIVLLEDISPFSIGCISKTQPSSQRKHDLICPESTPVTKMPSSFHVEEAFPKDVTSSTLGPTISEEEYLPTKKRASLESLDDLIRICTNKTQNIDFRPVKCKRKSMETHPPPFSGNLAPGDHSGSVIQETNSSLKKCHPKAVDGIAVSTSQPIAQGSNLMSVQPINVTRNSRWDSKTLKSPSTRQGIQCVTADLPPARSSPQECSMIKSQSAVPGMQCVMPDPPPASVIQETNSSSKKCPPKAVDGIVVSTSHPIAQGSNLMSVQPINVASKSRWDSKTLKSPSTRQGIQSVTQDPPPARSSPQECSMIMTDNSTNTVVSREPNLFKTEKPQLANISQSSIPEQTEVLQCHTILENRVQYDCKLDKDHRQMAAPQGNTNTVELSENRVNCNLDRAHREMLTGAMAGPSESQLSSSGSHIPFVSQVNSESAPIALTTDHRTAGSHSLGKNNVEESSALQFHFPQGANHFTMPFLGHYPSAMGWMNQPSQQWLQHQQYSLPWVQNTVNWTNDPNYLCNFSFATALYPGHILPPVPSGGQGNVSFSQPSKAQFSKNK
ncbi:uncharacterized protein LOC130910324 isoform X3 [Corythoichthys intestinalis]|uniref:uncharacterized protein LOC130910324 isoform X3 n=1 Tax=Corythoichthys intestinalis TaxID=161448 RepID=UPI0025A5E729|nr:uncharacterized protein LOC130910324 isoform X3 [Corythoichthys intestinalis]